jgi:hypothetical protein
MESFRKEKALFLPFHGPMSNEQAYKPAQMDKGGLLWLALVLTLTHVRGQTVCQKTVNGKQYDLRPLAALGTQRVNLRDWDITYRPCNVTSCAPYQDVSVCQEYRGSLTLSSYFLKSSPRYQS